MSSTGTASTSFLTDITALLPKASSAGSAVLSGILSLFSASLSTLAEDELVILGDAIAKMRSSQAAGSTWEEALTAAYNTFYNEEETEAQKIATGILAAVNKVLSFIEAL